MSEEEWERREMNIVKREWREKRIKNIKSLYHFYSYRVKIEGYCSMLQKFDTFNTSDKAPFFVFGVPNAKYYSI